MADVLVNSTLARGRKRMVTRKKYDSERKWDAQYKKDKTKMIGVRFFPSDMELHDFAKTHDNVSGYIKDLIRADMERNQ